MHPAPLHPSFPSLPSSRFVPTPDLFWHRRTLHGQVHVSRVMVHAIRLVEATGQHALAPRLWASVFLHDLARRHDGVCHRHGADAARRLREEPALQQRLAEAGLTPADHSAIEAAVTAHSAPKDVSRHHEHWPLIALLKDADGLDRVRLADLDPRFLRHDEAHDLVDFAHALFDATDGVIEVGEGHFEALWAAARELA
jgi:hypothetical protein